MQMLVELSGVAAEDEVLDVACGPGLVACEFALKAKQVTGVDITPRMLELAAQRQKEKGLENLDWVLASVIPLPFPDARFSVVVTRYSFHHFLDPKAALDEMIRVCRPGGRVVIADVVQPPEKADHYDRLEKLRDPSHVHALTVPEMSVLVAASGLSEVRVGRYKVEGEVEQQIRASFPEPGNEARIRAMFRDDLEQDRLGIDVHLEGDEIHFAVPILVVAGMKADLPA